MAQNPELALLELEERLLTMCDQAWEAYEEAGAGMPPMALLNILTKAHDTISKRIKAKLGTAFDPEHPEMALIELDRMRQLLERKIEQRARLRATVPS